MPTAPLLQLYDTTLRDGTQREGLSLSVDDKLKIARALDRLGVHLIEGGWPGSNPKDAEYFRRVRELPLATARIAAFGSTGGPGPLRRTPYPCAGGCQHPGGDLVGKTSHPARGPGAGYDARRKPAHDRRERPLLQADGTR